MCSVDRALRIVAPIPNLYAHVLDIFRAIVRILHETDLADVLGSRHVGAFVEVDQAVIAAMDRCGIEVRMTGISLDIERLGRWLLDPTILACPLRLDPIRKHQDS